MKQMNKEQKQFFEMVCACGNLILAIGPVGISANLVGKFVVRRQGQEDRLDLLDGTNHVHIDWQRVKKAVVTMKHGEGLVDFFDNQELLFKLYRVGGPFPEGVKSTILMS